jgi:hypothetical protein
MFTQSQYVVKEVSNMPIDTNFKIWFVCASTLFADEKYHVDRR